MIKYEIRKLDDDTIQQMIELSRLWVEEDCSYGLVENKASDLSEPLAVALDGEEIIGYIFGHFYKQENKTSYIEIGSECFFADELYVLPRYRCQGVGKALFRIMEDHVKGRCSYMTLSTSTKDYRAILNLYVEELGMNFHSAFLIKDMIEKSREENSDADETHR